MKGQPIKEYRARIAMSVLQNNALKLLFPVLTTLTIGACVSGTSEEDEAARDKAEKNIRSELWMTPDCVQDNSGQYSRGLYKFQENGEIASGKKGFQDASCSTQSDQMTQPSVFAGTYAVVDPETLEDGSDGFSFDYTIFNDNILAYFRLTNSDTLCFSNNLQFRLDKVHVDLDRIDPKVDYQNCMTVYRASNDDNPNPNPNPDPNPNPNPSSSLLGVWVLNTQCRVDKSGNHFIWLIQFNQNKTVTEAFAYFNNDNCSGQADASEFSDFDVVYEDYGAATLPDGNPGYRLQLTQGQTILDGYYVFDAQNRLCVSHSLGLTLSGESSDGIDYNNCFSRPD
jgi:hypothetical protein